MIFPLIL